MEAYVLIMWVLLQPPTHGNVLAPGGSGYVIETYDYNPDMNGMSRIAYGRCNDTRDRAVSDLKHAQSLLERHSVNQVNFGTFRSFDCVKVKLGK